MDTTYRHCGGWTVVRGENEDRVQREAFQKWYQGTLVENDAIASAPFSIDEGQAPSEVEVLPGGMVEPGV